MKNTILSVLIAIIATHTNAQVGIGTVSPTSTLDVRGSFSSAYRSFSSSSSASSSDHTLAFTGSAAASLTLPDATACTGRIYIIKNASTTSPTPVVTINTTSSQTIDGLSTYLLNQSYTSVVLVSNGTNWNVAAQASSASSGNAWTLGGNNVPSLQNFGTTSNYDLPFITNNTENMRLSATGNLGIGTSVFNSTYPEKLVVNAGTTTSVNAIVGKGSINNYLQLNIQNNNAGANASSDVVATADNGTETTDYVDMGINSSVNTSGVMGNANDAYLYNIGQNFLLGTGTASKSLIFLTGGTTQSANERMRIDGSGNIGIGTNSPSYKLHVSATSNPLYLAGVQTGANTDSVLTILNGVVRKVNTSVLGGNFWALGGNNVSSLQNFGTTSNFDLPFITNNTENMRLSATGNLGIGTSTFNATFPEKLVVNAGTTTSVNAIVGKGSINNYLQLNIQNNNAGANASSDVVATADNGSETTNYVDMGINSSVNTSGVMGNANDAYLYNIGQNFLIGTGAAAKALVFMTGGTTQSTNERMRIDGSGNVGIANNAPTQKLDITGNLRLSGAFMPGNAAGVAGTFLTSSGAGLAPTWIDPTAYLSAIAWEFGGNSVPSIQTLGTTSNFDLPFITNNTEKMRLSASGDLGIGTNSPNSTLDVSGSSGLAITTTSSNITLGAANSTVIITGGTPVISLPAAAAANARRIYVIVNQTGAPRTISAYLNFSGASTTTIATASSITLQSDGTNWYRIQ